MLAKPVISQGAEFKQFLYAPIYDDAEGMPLSVLSALAREDIDPWSEAARLSCLSESTAFEQIIAHLDALPTRTVASLDRMKVASRLSALLPRVDASRNPAVMGVPARGRRQTPIESAFNLRFFCFYLFLMLIMNWLVAEFHTQSPAVAGPALSAGAATTAPKASSTPKELEKAPNPAP